VRAVSSETSKASWVAADDVAVLDLHPGFAVWWPVLREALLPLTIIVDGANVMGSRPDGWWRDRAAAARRLRDQLAVLRADGVTALPEPIQAPELERWFPDIVLVVEGAARSVAAGRAAGQVPVSPGGEDGRRGPAREPGAARGAVRVIAAPGSGDDTIAEVAADLAGRRLVVTADRELRARCEVAGASVTGPSWLLGQI
jgi:hypothetical protein